MSVTRACAIARQHLSWENSKLQNFTTSQRRETCVWKKVSVWMRNKLNLGVVTDSTSSAPCSTFATANMARNKYSLWCFAQAQNVKQTLCFEVKILKSCNVDCESSWNKKTWAPKSLSQEQSSKWMSWIQEQVFAIGVASTELALNALMVWQAKSSSKVCHECKHWKNLRWTKCDEITLVQSH